MTAYADYAFEFSWHLFLDAWGYSSTACVFFLLCVLVNARLMFLWARGRHVWGGIFSLLRIFYSFFSVIVIGGPIASENFTTEENDLWLFLSLIGTSAVMLNMNITAWMKKKNK